MPEYSYSCGNCGSSFVRSVQVTNRKTQRCECGSLASQTVVSPNFVMLGDQWVGKNLQVKQQMETKNRVVSQKQKNHVAPPLSDLIPNFGGVETESWTEAKEMAKKHGKDESSYDSLIVKEKRKKKNVK